MRYLAKAPGIEAAFFDRELLLTSTQGAVRLQFIGVDHSVMLEPVEPLQGRVNFLVGADQSKWIRDAQAYLGIRYRSLYKGIDAVFSSARGRLKSDFIVAPRADPGQIRIAYVGARVEVDKGGGLRLRLGTGEVTEAPPEVYQRNSTGIQEPVSSAYLLHDDGTVGFRLGPYDRSRTLWIDPEISYSTYLGSSYGDGATSVAVDGAGAAYLAGWTEALNFPAVNAYSTARGGVDAFVAKLNPAGTALVYATYIGGSGDDRALSLAVDSTGNAVLTGFTTSTNFPVTAPAQGGPAGGRDAFVTKLNAAGNGLVFSTYLGGSAADSGNGIALGAFGDIYVAGDTTSTNFPVLNPYQTGRGGQDGFVARFTPAGALVYSTYLGGQYADRAVAVAVDSTGAAYVTGSTESPNFPSLGGFQPSIAGGQDVFVTKLAASGSSIFYSTFVGGAAGSVGSPEGGHGIAVDVAGSAYVTGVTSSSNFPAASPVQPGHGGGTTDAFVLKISSTGASLIYGTFLGGSGGDSGKAIRVDSTGSAYVAGDTYSLDFFLVQPFQAEHQGSYDAFVTKVNPAGTAFLFSTYLGGKNADTAAGIAVDGSGDIYVAGLTQSTNFPTGAAVYGHNAGLSDAWVAKIRLSQGNVAPSAVSVMPSSGSGSSQTFSFTFSDPNGFADLSSVRIIVHTQIQGAGSCYLYYTRGDNKLYLHSDDAAVLMGPLTPGAAGTIQNSQCSVNGVTSSVSSSAAKLTLNLTINFTGAYLGAKSVFGYATDEVGLDSGWQTLGSWTVLSGNAAPAAVSVTPSSGSGSSQTFSFIYSDPNGFADLSSVRMIVHSQIRGAGSCYLYYTRGDSKLYLHSDDAAALLGPLPPGSPGTIQNSQCSVNGATSSVSSSGTNLTLNLAMSFTEAYSGAKSLFGYATDQAGLDSAWQMLGSWTVSSANTAPAAVSVTPLSGSGSSRTFSFIFSDPNGFADLSSVRVIVHSQIQGASSCYLYYTRHDNKLYLHNDPATALLGPLTPGMSGTVQNSQCSVNAATSSVSSSSTNLTLNLAMSFTGSYSGTKSVFGFATDQAGLDSGWQTLGSWTVSSVNAAPSAVSTTPSSGSGSSQMFSFLFSDPDGFADLSSVRVIVHSQVQGAASCYLYYTRGDNKLYLHSDAATALLGSLTPGVAGTIQNSQCSVNGATSSVSSSGTHLTLNLAMSFTVSYSGAKSVFGYATDQAGLNGAWATIGSWTVP